MTMLARDNGTCVVTQAKLRFDLTKGYLDMGDVAPCFLTFVRPQVTKSERTKELG